MFFDDKHRPHFHAAYAEYKASIEIESGYLMVGKLPKRAYQLVLVWRKMHRAELLDNWERARRQEPLLPIDPLE